MQKIIVRKGAMIIEAIEGRARRKIPAIRTVAYDIPTRGTKLTDPELDDVVWEFQHDGKTWTVGAEWVTEV